MTNYIPTLEYEIRLEIRIWILKWLNWLLCVEAKIFYCVYYFQDRPWTPAQLDLVKSHLLSGIGVLQLYIMKLKGLCESSKDPVSIRSDTMVRWLENNSIFMDRDAVTHGMGFLEV